jgi:hypothetical protein
VIYPVKMASVEDIDRLLDDMVANSMTSVLITRILKKAADKELAYSATQVIVAALAPKIEAKQRGEISYRIHQLEFWLGCHVRKARREAAAASQTPSDTVMPL